MFILQHPKKNFRIHSKLKQPSMADWERKRESSDLGCPCQEYQKANRAVFMLFDTLFALFSMSSCSTDTNSKKSSFALIMDLQPQMCVCFSLVSFPGFFFLIYFPGFKARQDHHGQLSSLTASTTSFAFSPVILQEAQWLLFGFQNDGKRQMQTMQWYRVLCSKKP